MPGTITPIGVGVAVARPRQAPLATALYDTGVDPGNANAPIIYEPPAALTGGALRVWVITSGGPNWGGCEVWLSSDDTTYAMAGIIYRGARQGVLTASLPSHSDPDGSSTLAVDLTESQGQLLSGTQADADNLITLCYVDGELISYETATLTAANKYNLTYLRRGAYGTPISAHSTGTAFARVGANDGSWLEKDYAKSFVGQTIYVKLVSFNIHGQKLQDIASVPAYSYSLIGAGLGTGAVREVSGSQSGSALSGQVIFRRVFSSPISFAAAFAGSVAVAGTAATADAVYTIRRNGTAIGTMTFAAGQSVPSFAPSAAAAFASGDVLTITAPASPDATLAGLAWTLMGYGGGGPEVAGSQSGATTPNLVIGRWITRNPIVFPAGLGASKAVAGTAATAGTTYQIARNGTPFGNMTFGTGQTVASFAGTETAFSVGDLLTVIGPASPDATLKDIAWSLLATDELESPASTIGGSMSGPLSAGLIIARHVFVQTGIISPTEYHIATAGIPGAATTNFSVKLNGVTVGSLTFGAGASIAPISFSSTATYRAGDVLTIVTSASPDATLDHITWVITVSR